MLRVIFSAIGLVIIFFTAVLAYFGAFNSISVKEDWIGPYTLAYESHVGDYKLTGPSVDFMLDLSQKLGANPVAGFGLYYDDPNVVEKEKLKSDAGILIESKDIGKFQNYARDPHRDHKVLTREFPKTRMVIADFPLRGILSSFIGMMKVYPAILEYMNSHQLKMTYALEVYALGEKKVTYAFPVVK